MAGPSRSECLTPSISANDYGLSYVQAAVTNFDALTGTTVSCLSVYVNDAETWDQWKYPWVTNSMYGYSSWVNEDPQSRQLVLQVNLIPNQLEDVKDPLGWEQSCAAGDFDSYAKVLGQSLVSAGLQHSVIRLGAEMNGNWEVDYVGNTTQEQRLWATCFDNEVTALRSAKGEKFLIDWDPNACKADIPYARYYPGNAYVDIVGLDLYDVGCVSPTRSVSFKQLSLEPEGLVDFEAFAAEKGKPMSLPEWGLSSKPTGDDPGFIDGIGSTVADGDFAFETYFDVNDKGVEALSLGPHTPRAVVAFKDWFGAGSS